MFYKLQYHVSKGNKGPFIHTSYFSNKELLKTHMAWWNQSDYQYYLTPEDEAINEQATPEPLPPHRIGWTGTQLHDYLFQEWEPDETLLQTW